MTRLPLPGGDAGNWGEILNDYLAATHKSDGTLKDNSVGPGQLQDNAVTSAQIADGSITETLLHSSVVTKLNEPTTLTDSSVTTAKLQDDAVTGQKIASGTITNSHLSTTSAIDQSKIANLTSDLVAKASVSHTHAVSEIGSGTPGAGKYLDGSGTWTTLPTSGGALDFTRVVKNGDNTWPARPAVTFVEWVGPGSPDPPFSTPGDTWLNTSQNP